MNFLVSLFSIATAAAPLDLEQIHLRRLLGAENDASVQKIEKEYADIRQDRRICDLQLIQRIIPWTCYRLRQRESAWRILSSHPVKDLDENCKQAAHSLLHRRTQFPPVPTEFLSAACRNLLNQVQEINRYRAGEDWPEY